MTDAPMPLEAAVRVFFPHGGVTKSTLLAAIRAGTLGFEKVGRAYLVTEADISAWRTKCRCDYTLGADSRDSKDVQRRRRKRGAVMTPILRPICGGKVEKWSERRDSNPRPLPPQNCALDNYKGL